jgi:hypothetical protein
MKTVLLLATALTIVLANENATDDGLEDGQTKCPRDMNNDGEVDTDEFQICPFFAECAESTNQTFSTCVPKGNHVCYKYSKGGESGVIVGMAMATPSQSCCDGAVCTSRQTCVEVNDPSETFTYDFDEDSIPVSYTVGEVARNGWQNAKGEAFENKPKTCVNKVFDVTQGTRQIIAPWGSMVIIVIALILLFVKNQDGIVAMLLPLIVLVASFFLALSEAWIFALFTAFVAVATTSTSAEHQGKLVLFLLAFVWLYFGGMNLLFAWPTSETPDNYFRLAAQNDLLALETSCDTYFGGYYGLDASTRAWDTDGTTTTTGLCGRGFITFLIIMAYAQAAAVVTMVAFKVLAFLGAEVPTDSKIGACLAKLPCFRGTKDVEIGNKA